jgi:energy-coupling factor transporter ATP-binding protein EcfA2
MKPAYTPQQIADRTREFRILTVAHPVLLAAKDSLMAAINEAPAGSIVMVYGPTGVGKSTLRLKIQQLLTDQKLALMNTDHACVPFVSVEAAATDNGHFSWRDHYRRTLLALSEPMLEHKIQPNWIHMMHDSHSQHLLGPRSAAVELRHALESAILHRRPAAILVDEAQHLTRIASGRRLADQLEVIKSVSNCTQTIHILLGTYDLLALRQLNGQLVRRSLDIHFRRYSAESRQDLRVFKNVVLTFQERVPLDEPPDLLALWDLLYERSVGCIGVLKEWLDRALIAVLKEGCSTMSPRHLEATALSASQCEKIAIEAHEGEAQLSSGDQVQPRLRVLLGLSAYSDTPPVRNPVGRKRSVRVGRRNPRRDQVGVGQSPSKGARHVL